MTPAELRRRREAAGLSTRELGELLGVSAGLVQHWETGRKPVPRGRLSDVQRVLAPRAPVLVAPMLGCELRELRERTELTQEDLAQLLGVKRQAVAAWEAGEVPEARRAVLRSALDGTASPMAGLLRALRDRARLKQAELAELIGSSQATVSEWERGATPIPADRWPEIRDAIEAVAPKFVPPEQPLTPDEMRDGLHRAGWSLRQLAEAIDVKRGTIGPWASGHKAIPPERWGQIREVLGLAEPKPPSARDRDAEALDAVLALLEREPGLLRSEIAQRVDVPETYVRQAIRQALEAEHLHERAVLRTRRGGHAITVTELHPGPPGDVSMLDRTGVVVPEAVAAVDAKPGRTRRQVALALPHDRRLAARALSRALRAGLIHERGVIVRGERGARSQRGLFPGAAPAPAPTITGAKLREARERRRADRRAFAAMLGVGPVVLRRWEDSEVPAEWGQAVFDAIRELHATLDARDAELRERIVAAVRDQPGVPRWGDLARVVGLVDRARLGEVLDELVEAGRVHERAADNGHGAGLFPGPPPPGWEPGPELTGAELRAMRHEAGLSQRELAERIHAGVASVNGWERDTVLVPGYRAVQLRAFFATCPPAPAPIAPAELRAARQRAGWTQAELGARVGAKQPR